VRPGVRIALDLGERRIGVARSDASGLLAVPVTTITRTTRNSEQVFASIIGLLDEYEAIELLIGLPRTLSGDAGAAAQVAQDFANHIVKLTTCPVRLVDERLSTVQAQRSLHSAGRTSKSSRAVIDQAAAVVILQSALDSERALGSAPGFVVEVTHE